MGQINFAHTACTDRFFDLVGAEFLADERENLGAVARDLPSHQVHRRIFEKPVGFLLRPQKTENFAFQIVVAVAFFRQKFHPPLVRNFENGI